MFCVFKNGPTPASFIGYFRSFQTKISTVFTANLCEKCPSNIRCWDLNPWPSEHESPPITTRPRLPTCIVVLFQKVSLFEEDNIINKFQSSTTTRNWIIHSGWVKLVDDLQYPFKMFYSSFQGNLDFPKIKKKFVKMLGRAQKRKAIEYF